VQITDYESPILTTATRFSAGYVFFKCLLIQIIIHFLLFLTGHKISLSRKQNCKGKRADLQMQANFLLQHNHQVWNTNQQT